jgi:hypothetical protein
MPVDLATLGDILLGSLALATLGGLVLVQIREGSLSRRRYRKRR